MYLGPIYPSRRIADTICRAYLSGSTEERQARVVRETGTTPGPERRDR